MQTLTTSSRMRLWLVINSFVSPNRPPWTVAPVVSGWMLWYLTRVVDPVPAAVAAQTPLFRDPRSGMPLTVAAVRETLRLVLSGIGLDGSSYGAHSLRIGGATAMAWAQADHQVIKAGARSSDGA